MKNEKRQSGFSLIEVLFAMLILTMGIIFVAGQFPLGLANARKIAEETRSEVDAHNAAIMAELQIAPLDPTTFIGDDDTYFVNRDEDVHYLPRPNARLLTAGIPNIDNLVMDDPLLTYYKTLPVAGQKYYESGPPANHPLHPVTYYPITGFPDGVLLPENIGKIVSPPVDETDQDVQARLNHLGASIGNINRAVFDVATARRNFNIAQFYQHIGNNRFRFFVFTLRGSNKRLGYAVQDLSNLVVPDYLQSERFRYFPIPWQVRLPVFIDFIGDTSQYSQNNPEFPPPDRLIVHENVAAILRPGSILIDADFENPSTTWADNGYVYEVSEINQDINGYFMRLRTVLEDNLHNFWVFPPGKDPDNIDSITNEPSWANTQPVVKVTQKIVTF